MPQRLLRVIVVEDNKALCQAYSDILESDKQITAVQAHDLPEAVQLCRREPQVVMLVDLGLPSASGMDAITMMRKENPGATMVVITGDVDARPAALAAGAHEVIVKGSPESYGDGLILAVRNAVRVHDAELLFVKGQAILDRTEQRIEQAAQLATKTAAKILGTAIVTGLFLLLAWVDSVNTRAMEMRHANAVAALSEPATESAGCR